jgi:hypothetical protein
MPELDFAALNTLYATHGLHAYAAKCPPPLVRYGLHYYSKEAEAFRPSGFAPARGDG